MGVCPDEAETPPRRLPATAGRSPSPSRDGVLHTAVSRIRLINYHIGKGHDPSGMLSISSEGAAIKIQDVMSSTQQLFPSLPVDRLVTVEKSVVFRNYLLCCKPSSTSRHGRESPVDYEESTAATLSSTTTVDGQSGSRHFDLTVNVDC